MSSDGSVSRLISGLKEGDEEALSRIFERYYPYVVALARRKLGTMRRAADEDDVAQSVFWDLHRITKKKQLEQLSNRRDLLGLLNMITVFKAANNLAHELREKRGGGKVAGESAIRPPVGSESSRFGADQAADSILTPDEVKMLEDRFQLFLRRLPEDDRETVELSLAGLSKEDIAERHDCSTRTIERRMERCLKSWFEMAKQE